MICAYCGGEFDSSASESWNEDKAREELEQEIPRHAGRGMRCRLRRLLPEDNAAMIQIENQEPLQSRGSAQLFMLWADPCAPRASALSQRPGGRGGHRGARGAWLHQGGHAWPVSRASRLAGAGADRIRPSEPDMTPAAAAALLDEPDWVQAFEDRGSSEFAYENLLTEYRKWHFTVLDDGRKLMAPSTAGVIALAILGIMPPRTLPDRLPGLFEEQIDAHTWFVSEGRSWRILGIEDKLLCLNSFGEEKQIDLTRAKVGQLLREHHAAVLEADVQMRTRPHSGRKRRFTKPALHSPICRVVRRRNRKRIKCLPGLLVRATRA